MRKLLQYIKVVLICGPIIIYYHFRYMIRFAKHPEKYPLEQRYKIVRKEVIMVAKHFHSDYIVEGLDKFTESKDKAILISNHLSFFDPFIIIANSEKPVAFVAKKEVFSYPFAGKVAKALDVFSLNRENLMSQFSEIKKIVSFLKDPTKPSVIIYIEGTRNRHPENPCLEFHPGTLKIAQMAESNLMISATYGSFRILDKKSYLKKYPCFFKIFETIDSSALKALNTITLAEELKEKTNAEVDEFRRKDLAYIKDMKISEKRKALEAKVDIRVKS